MAVRKIMRFFSPTSFSNSQNLCCFFFCLFAWEEIALHRVVEKNYMPLPKKLKTKFFIVKDN